MPNDFTSTRSLLISSKQIKRKYDAGSTGTLCSAVIETFFKGSGKHCVTLQPEIINNNKVMSQQIFVIDEGNITSQN